MLFAYGICNAEYARTFYRALGAGQAWKLHHVLRVEIRNIRGFKERSNSCLVLQAGMTSVCLLQALTASFEAARAAIRNGSNKNFQGEAKGRQGSF